MKPKIVTREVLVEALRDMTREIESNASFEGSINYTCMRIEEDGVDPPFGSFFVLASYRVGNDMGQGGMRLIGEME